VIPQLVKASEIRKLLNLDSDSRVYDLARRELLPGVVHIGRQVRFNLAEVLNFIQQGGTTLSGGWRHASTAEKSTKSITPRVQDVHEERQS
jgi:hypothetical protein